MDPLTTHRSCNGCGYYCSPATTYVLENGHTSTCCHCQVSNPPAPIQIVHLQCPSTSSPAHHHHTPLHPHLDLKHSPYLPLPPQYSSPQSPCFETTPQCCSLEQKVHQPTPEGPPCHTPRQQNHLITSHHTPRQLSYQQTPPYYAPRQPKSQQIPQGTPCQNSGQLNHQQTPKQTSCLTPRRPKYQQTPQGTPHCTPGLPKYQQTPQGTPHCTPGLPKYQQTPQGTPHCTPGLPKYQQTPQGTPHCTPGLPKYQQTPQGTPHCTPGLPKHQQTPQGTPHCTPGLPKYQQTPQHHPPSVKPSPSVARTPKTIELSKWFFRVWQAGWITLEGERKQGDVIGQQVSGPVSHRQSQRVIFTKSGTRYRLVGNLHRASMSGTLGDEKCLPVGKKIAGQFLRGFPCNWAELIKQVHRVDEPKASQNEVSDVVLLTPSKTKPQLASPSIFKREDEVLKLPPRRKLEGVQLTRVAVKREMKESFEEVHYVAEGGETHCVAEGRQKVIKTEEVQYRGAELRPGAEGGEVGPDVGRKVIKTEEVQYRGAELRPGAEGGEVGSAGGRKVIKTEEAQYRGAELRPGAEGGEVGSAGGLHKTASKKKAREVLVDPLTMNTSCFTKYEQPSPVQSKPKRKRRASKVTFATQPKIKKAVYVDPLVTPAAKPGTVRRKKQFRQAVNKIDQGYSDDIFEATPLKRRAKPVPIGCPEETWELSLFVLMISDDDEENEDTGGDNDVIMGRNSTTPSDNWRVKLGAPLVSTPKLLDCLESPEYRAVSGKERDVADKLVMRRGKKKASVGNKNSKKVTTAPTFKPKTTKQSIKKTASKLGTLTNSMKSFINIDTTSEEDSEEDVFIF